MRKFLLATAAMLGMATSTSAMDFNLGVQGGYGWSDSDYSNDFHGESYSIEGEGWILGGFAGVDWDVGPGWSLGVEGDYNWTDAEGDHAGIHGAYNIEQSWNASVRARAAFDIAANTELFGSLGMAWSEVDVTDGPGCVGCNTGIDTLEGWTGGIGLERQYTGWFGRIEYRYTAYDDDDFDHSGSPASVDLTTHALLVGGGWSFGP